MDFLKVLIIVLNFIIGYIFGSIPFSVILSKYIYKKDILNEGSHNPGATNVGRTISKKAGLITIVLDLSKVIIPFITIFLINTKVIAINNFLNEGYDININYWYGKGSSLLELSYYTVLLGAFIGHSYSIFLGFKGGKIVSTFSAMIVSTTCLAFPLFLVIFLIILKLKKHVSLSSIITSSLFTIFVWILYIVYCVTLSTDIIKYFLFFDLGPSMSIYFPIISTLGSFLLVYRHKDNIKRLKEHKEYKVSWIDHL